MADPTESRSSNPQVSNGATPTIGRTPWDFAAEAIRSRTAFFIVAAVFLVMPTAIHFLAEPGSEVNLFLGLIKYKKALPAPEPSKPEPPPKQVEPIPSTYVLPVKKAIIVDEVIPILDGSINVVVVYSPQGEDDHLRIGGVNIPKVRAAARLLNGNPVELTRNATLRTLDVPGQTDCHVEIEYLQHVFALSVHKTGYHRYELSVTPSSAPTLDLRSFTFKW